MDAATKSSGYVAARTLLIIAPDEPPVTKTLDALTLYLGMAYVTIFAMALESPPPLWLREALLDTSQHVPLFGLLGQMVI
jgi:hypothetical protein